ncbi:DNA polymerase III subunit psi [Vibrio sp. SM6]|uniref:DNA polymerase III subunit psi n=1 Tax=Vibrio agarilyticus TaxID=2726741 RepID=A0A7X8YGU4_9VIBR|nr:DNA polymerase III subunit psi [Vibrio agarilyticus]NLS12712.1 DNA polymerase III subunit psi [Vibrio agarilyticus]
MSPVSAIYLREMGIDQYVLAHPERLAGYQPPSITLSHDCQLLLVTPVAPNDAEVSLFERVLKAMHLTLSQAQWVTPEQWTQVEPSSALQWLWFAGCSAQGLDTERERWVLTSPRLSDIDGHTQHRRDLWQQIQSAQAGNA